jgi:hypothetical protein
MKPQIALITLRRSLLVIGSDLLPRPAECSFNSSH